jgi:eukaryotic-like serine/threonine-protein kinase
VSAESLDAALAGLGARSKSHYPERRVRDPLAPPGDKSDQPPTETLSGDEVPTPDDMAGEVAALPRGRSIDRFMILDRIGEGGMGVVYAAYDPTLDRRLALKFLRNPSAGRDSVREARLLREARAMARLSHPNVAVLYEVGTFEGQVFLAMEFVDGVDLRTWLAEKPRSFSEIMEVFRAAGRGLAAAHAAGIVHRDFKPENVLVDVHGRPRVTDFGLSRAADEGEDGVAEPTDPRATAPTAPSYLSRSLTRTGGVLGTPPYMAPEQVQGGRVDARCDQYAFCVTLHEAVYKERPLAGDGVKLAPAHSSVPRWYRDALVRGLATKPEERFASMDALLAALTPRPTGRRSIAIAAALAAIVAGGGAYALSPDRSAENSGPRCDLGVQRLAGTWDQARARQLRGAFLKSGARDADVTWKGFAAIVDRWAATWTAMHDQTCAATHVDGTQSPAVLDLRMECLDRKRQDAKALVDVFAENTDPSKLDRAIDAADELPALSACADVANLRTVIPAPESSQTRTKVRALRDQLSHSRAVFEAGRYEEGLPRAESLAAEAKALGYAPLAAESAQVVAGYLDRVGDAEKAEKALFDAVRHAIQGRHARLEAELWSALVATYPRDRAIPQTRLTAEMADLAIERAGGDDLMRARLASNIGAAEGRAANWAEAVRHLERAVALYTRSGRTGSPEFARALTLLGSNLVDLGRYRDARDRLERALSMQRAFLRPGHPDIASTLYHAGHAHMVLGQLQRAREAAQRSHAIRLEELGPEHVALTYSMVLLAEIEARLGNVDRALELATAALTSRAKSGDRHGLYAASGRFHLGHVQWRAGRLRDAERSLAQARDVFIKARPDHPGTAYVLMHLGFVHNERGQFAKALAECERARDIIERKRGIGNASLLEPVACLAEALIGTGRSAAARQELERALSPSVQRELGPQLVSASRFLLARALWESPADRPRARELARDALTRLAGSEGDNRREIARIQAWLSTHG